MFVSIKSEFASAHISCRQHFTETEMLSDALLMLSVFQPISCSAFCTCVSCAAINIILIYRCCQSKKNSKLIIFATNHAVTCWLLPIICSFSQYSSNALVAVTFSCEPKCLQSYRKRPSAKRRKNKGGRRLQSFHQGSWQWRAESLSQRTK